MTFNYHQSKIQADARRQQLDDEYNRDALADSIKPKSAKTGAIYAPVLAKAGEILESLGQQLQDRYGNTHEAPLPMKPALNSE